jgi:hypothetical protein
MAKRGQGKAVATLRQKAGPRSGFVRAVLYVKPEQLAALHELAKERAEERGALRPDVSEAARSVLDGWIGKQ